MKKTLFLSAVLTLSSVSASAATDCLMPQTIINVSDGTATQNATSAEVNVTIHTKNAEDSSKSVSELMTQEALTVASERPAVVKDGQGTLEISEDVGTLNTTLIVREGTLSIKGATVSTLGSKNGNNLVIGGINAKMVLSDGASYTFTDSDRTSSSVNIGGIDGDGTLILTGGSSLSTRQTLFSGTATTLPIPTFENPYWDAGPHYGGTYTNVDGSEKNAYYRVATEAAGYSNKTTTPRGSLAGTAVIKVTEGSTLSTGTGFYVGNTTLTIDNATVESGTVNNSDNVWIGSSNVFGPASKAVVNITNGGKWLAQHGQYAAISYYAGEQSEINISGEGSLMHVTNLCYLGSTNTSKSEITISEGGELKFDSYIYARGAADSCHTIVVDGENSKLTASEYYLYGATSVDVRKGALMQGANIQANRSDIALTVADGGKIALTGQLSLSNSATLDIVGEGSSVTATYAFAQSGSTVSIGEGAALTAAQTQLRSGGTLINRGTLSGSVAFLFGGSRLQTGELLISGCEGLVAAGHELETNYDNTGLGEEMSLSTAYAGGVTTDAGTITVGALLTGKNEMQFLFSSDLQSINEAVFAGLAIEGTESYTIAYKHEIGENITMNYTTDDLNTVTGTESIAVKGGAILVEQGEGEHHIGTIGSYAETTTETTAAIAVHEQTAGSSVTWQGTELQTVAGERTIIAADNQVNVTPDSAQDSGKLTVVSNSELQVQGCITAGNITVESGAAMTNNGVLYAGVTVEGTLKGSGTIEGALQVSRDGTLIVGNSPGYQIVSSAHLEDGSNTVFCIAGMAASTEGNTGWASGTASQLCITEGSLTLDTNACITIEFGGDTLIIDGNYGEMQAFAVTLVQGGCEELTAGQLTSLLAHTTFTLTSDAEGLTGLAVPSSGVISVSGATYEVHGSDLVLTGTMTFTPEPTTATLSLLALAGLCARRRRRAI